MFSGVDCAAIALQSLRGAALELYGVDLSSYLTQALRVEKKKACQQVLLRANKEACLFSDILSLVAEWSSTGSSNQDSNSNNNKSATGLRAPLGDKSLELVKQCECLAHRGQCTPPSHRSQVLLDVSGPPCVAFSHMGKRLGFTDMYQEKVHSAYMATIRHMEPVAVLHENVTSFPGEVLHQSWPHRD